MVTGGVIDEEFFGDIRDSAVEEASESLAAKLAEVDGLKTFPVVAQKILALLSSRDFQVREVSNALKEDPSLAAGVLRMANSAFFAGTKQVSTIDQAFVRLGSRSVQEVVASVATMDLFPDSGGVGKMIRDHCAATAAIGKFLANEFSAKHSEGIFLAGLMHDVGKMLLIESGEIDYASESIDAMKPDFSYQEERSLLGYDHAVLGAHVLTKWKLPSPIPTIVAWHHQPERAFRDGNLAPYVALLRVADRVDSIVRGPSKDKTEAMLDRLAEGPECAKVWITADDLKEHYETMIGLRQSALEMFGG